MRPRRNQSVTWRWLIAAALSLAACKQAGYEVLKPGLLNPNNFDGNKSIPPTARVEVIDRGVSVTWIYAGSRIDVRPSADTVDADYIGKSKCDNPGIILASYELGNGAKPTVKRNSCSTLASVGQTFNAPGDYLIKMQITSEDNETATASMTLRVVDRSIPADKVEGGFTIHAKPILAALNAPVTFTGICELKGKLNINWDYADQSNGAGAVTQHTYQKPGQYLVNATCSSDTGKKLSASLTVVVIDGTPPTIPEVPVPIPANNPNIPHTQNCDPSQGPCQNAGQIPNGRQLPDRSGPVWYYDPFCRCYIRQ
jgi:hypothetical protein